MANTGPKAAAVQMVTGPDLQANLHEVERLIREATGEGAGLVILPENFAFMGMQDQDILALGERDGNGPLQAFLSACAVRYRAWIVGGTIPLVDQDANRVRAACLLFNAQGKRVARYDKIHLFDVNIPDSGEQYRESRIIDPGITPVVVTSPWGRLGLAVCYDLRFPELFRRLLDQGAELITVPAAFAAATGSAHWEILVRARAVENLVFIVAAAQGGNHDNGRKTHGHSMIVDPWGGVLAELDKGAGTICATIDHEFLATVRHAFPAIQHRRLRDS